MKSEEHHQTQPQTTLSQTINHIAFDPENLHCSKGNIATFLCQNKNCPHVSMICSQKDCQCQQTHKKCLKTFSEQLFTEINKKIQPTSQIKERVDKIIDDAIDFISDIRDEIHLNLKYLGLNQDQKHLIEILNQKEYDQISGSKVWKICQKIYEEKQIESNYIIKAINSYWIEHEQKFKRQFERIRDLSEKEGRTKNIFKDSAIIIKDEDSENILKFFQEEIVSVKQLYSASKSKYQMKKYHQDCSGKKNLLTIVKGLNGKIFGGFWPSELPKGPHLTTGFGGGALVELSPKSFIFSLSNKDKFKLFNEGNSSFQNFDPNEGPNFGNNCLAIYRKIPNAYRGNTNLGGFGGGFGGFGAPGQMPATHPGGFNFGATGTANFNNPNQVNAELNEHYCVVLDGSTFRHENYDSTRESKMKFAGTEDACFQIKEWEVYQIKFVQKEDKL